MCLFYFLFINVAYVFPGKMVFPQMLLVWYKNQDKAQKFQVLRGKKIDPFLKKRSVPASCLHKGSCSMLMKIGLLLLPILA